MSVERCGPFGVALAAAAGVLCGASPADAQPNCCSAGYMEFVLDEPAHSCLDGHVPVSSAARFWCCDGVLTQTTANVIWGCAPPWVPDPTTYLTMPPGSIVGECPADYQSTCSPADGPIQCDGTEPWQDREIDQGCGEDEHGCEQRDQDGYPMRLSSGIVTIQPIVVFDATPDGIADGNFKYELRWGSHHGRNRAFGTPPDIHHERQVFPSTPDDGEPGLTRRAA